MFCFPFGMIRLIADDLWDSLCLSNATHILHFWWFVLQESPATFDLISVSGRLLRYYINWKWWFLFEHSLDFGAKFGDIPIWLLYFPKFSDAQYLKYMWTILHYPSQFGKQPSPSLRSNEKSIQYHFLRFVFLTGRSDQQFSCRRPTLDWMWFLQRVPIWHAAAPSLQSGQLEGLWIKFGFCSKKLRWFRSLANWNNF